MERDIVRQIGQNVQKVYDIYSSNPDVAKLREYAPLILQSFKEIKILEQQHQASLNQLIVQENNSLKRFDRVVPTLLNEIKNILADIRSLQQIVRDYAAHVYVTENAQTVIDYTNSQIDQNIRIFNSLTQTILSL